MPRAANGGFISTYRSSPATMKGSDRRRTRCGASSARRATARSRITSRSRPTPGTSCLAGLKIDLLDSIAREYDWVLGTLGDHA
jgi:hypothetical protein